MKVKDLETTTKNYAKKSLMAFLKGEKTINWIIGVIKSSGIRREKLKVIFDRLQNYGDKKRFNLALEKCKEQGLI